jgi:hypothetical protein
LALHLRKGPVRLIVLVIQHKIASGKIFAKMVYQSLLRIQDTEDRVVSLSSQAYRNTHALKAVST